MVLQSSCRLTLYRHWAHHLLFLRLHVRGVICAQLHSPTGRLKPVPFWIQSGRVGPEASMKERFGTQNTSSLDVSEQQSSPKQESLQADLALPRSQSRRQQRPMSLRLLPQQRPCWLLQRRCQRRLPPLPDRLIGTL